MLLALTAALAFAAGPVQDATDAQTHRIAIEIRQPRWTCFTGLIAKGSTWGSLRRIETPGCPELPWAILVREERSGWREVRRFHSRRAACRARPKRLAAAQRRALLGCHSADSSHQ